MDNSQTTNGLNSSGCGCGKNNSKSIVKPKPLSQKQEDLINRIQKTNHKNDSVYKTNTRYFI
jgi:hypothetical protein